MWHLKTRLIKHTDKDKKKQEDALIIEKTIDLELNGHHHHCFSTSGGDEIALSLGHLYLEYKDLKFDRLQTRYDQGTVSIKSPKIALHKTPFPPLESPPIAFNKIVIFQLTAYLQENALLFKHTAISESAAIANHQEILYFSEDIYRLNAIKKVFGKALLGESKPPYHHYILLTSGKVDLALVKMAHIMGIPLIISRTGVTDKALFYGQTNNIGLIGFARGKRFNLYHLPKSITFC